MEEMSDGNISISDVENIHSDSRSCQALSNSETVVRLITSHRYTLLSFVETRWYSAWLVMCRFLSLFNVLISLKDNMI